MDVERIDCTILCLDPRVLVLVQPFAYHSSDKRETKYRKSRLKISHPYQRTKYWCNLWGYSVTKLEFFTFAVMRDTLDSSDSLAKITAELHTVWTENATHALDQPGMRGFEFRTKMSWQLVTGIVATVNKYHFHQPYSLISTRRSKQIKITIHSLTLVWRFAWISNSAKMTNTSLDFCWNIIADLIITKASLLLCPQTTAEIMTLSSFLMDRKILTLASIKQRDRLDSITRTHLSNVETLSMVFLTKE